MLLNYRNPDFWKAFQAQYWKPRIPTVLRQPFKQFPFSEDLLLRGMKGFEAGIRAGDHRKHCLVSIDDGEVDPREPLKKLFQERIESLADLEQACGRVFDDKNFGLMITNMHATDPGIWNGLAAFIQDARGCVPFPVPRAHTDLFYGRYSANFTGLHKDTQEIFAFVIRGRKRMLAWPFDYFLTRVKGVTAADRYFNKRLNVDYRQFRQDAIVLDAEAGDVIHWPSDHWHLAEPLSDGFSAMLSLGIHIPDLAPTDAGHSRVQDLLSKAVPSQDMPEAISRRHAAGQMRWVTGLGFEMGGPVDETATKPAAAVVKIPSSIVLWHRNPSKRQIVVASGGHSATLPSSPETESLLARIARGDVVSASSAEDTTKVDIVETYWTKRCDLKERVVKTQNVGAWLMAWLLRVRAAEPVKS